MAPPSAAASEAAMMRKFLSLTSLMIAVCLVLSTLLKELRKERALAAWFNATGDEAFEDSPDMTSGVGTMADTNDPLSEFNLMELEMENLPVNFIMNFSRSETSCVKFPELHEVHSSNLYWQVLRTNKVTLYLYGAYHDGRASNPQGPVVRILLVGQLPRVEKLKLQCQFWYEDVDLSQQQQPVVVPASSAPSFLWTSPYPGDVPHTFSCPLRPTNVSAAPAAVSVVVAGRCRNATNVLRVHNRPPREVKGRFAVCLKFLAVTHRDKEVAKRLVEWLEMLRVFGVEKVFIYDHDKGPRVERVFNYYTSTGFVTVRPITYGGTFWANQPFLHQFFLDKLSPGQDMISINDCYFRAMEDYEYVALFDLDEMIVPLQHDSWTEMISDLEEKHNDSGVSHFAFWDTYFLDEWTDGEDGETKTSGSNADGTSTTAAGPRLLASLPAHAHMFRRVFRTRDFDGATMKSIFRPAVAEVIYMHHAFFCFDSGGVGGKRRRRRRRRARRRRGAHDENCNPVKVSTDVGHLAHYRGVCRSDNSCGRLARHPVRDESLLRFKDQVLPAVERVWREIKLSTED